MSESATTSSIPSPRSEPHNNEAEVAVLGGLLINREAWDLVGDMLSPEDFYSEKHRIIFRCMLDIHERNEVLDPLTLLEEIRQRKQDGKVTALYISSLADAVFSTANIRHHAEIVSKNAVLRKMIASCSDIIEEASSGVPDVQDFLDRSETRIFEVARTRTSSGPLPISEPLKKVFQALEERTNSNEPLTGLDTGFYHLNNLTLGLQPGDLIILAARPSMGKTAFALNLLLNTVSRSKRAGLFFSLEMPAESLVTRLICAKARVRSEDFRRGKFKSGEDYRKIIEAVQFFQPRNAPPLPIFIDDTSSISLMEVRARCRRLMAEQKDLGIVIIDYLQLMQGDRTIQSREQQVSLISRGLKSLAKDLGLPVIALSQLNREVEKRSDKRPTMADLRESGAIEQDADLIAFLYREEVYNREDPDAKGKAEIILAKHRNGETGKVDLKFFKEYGLFENLANDTEFMPPY